MTEELRKHLLPEGRGFVSVTGGGGKTSFLIFFSKVLKEEGKSVLLTTTTKIEPPWRREWGVDRVFSDSSVLCHVPRPGEAVLYAIPFSEGKWSAPGEEDLAKLSGMYDVVIAEADGSRHRPLKVHTKRDPVIHPLTTATVAVLGLWGIGKEIKTAVFGDEREGTVDDEYLDWYIKAPEGLLKGLRGNKLVLLNGAESYPAPKLELPSDVALCAASLREGRIMSYVF